MNAPTIIIIAVVVVLAVFAVIQFFGKRRTCHQSSNKNLSRCNGCPHTGCPIHKAIKRDDTNRE